MAAGGPVSDGAARGWPSTLDVEALLAGGWQPTPFREFVVKIHSRCDLACDYCYMYEMADQSWRQQPLRMSRAVLGQAAQRIAEHAEADGLAKVTVVLHGGEPLLAGPDLITYAAAAIRSAVPGVHTRVDRGSRPTPSGWITRYLRLFSRLGIRVGVSLDGDRAGQDRHRRRRGGQGSHAEVSEALRRISSGEFRHLFSGLLCTIDIRNDPLATDEARLAFQPPTIDFLLPHGNWTSPPPGRQPGTADTPYASWLIPVFDRWYRSPGRPAGHPAVHGNPAHAARRGLGHRSGRPVPRRCLVIETDGSIEGEDGPKSAYPGAPVTGLHISRNRFDEALLLPSVAARQIGVRALCEVCRSCPVHWVCGGGLDAHRYRSGTGFANPSVYSPDLFRLISHIQHIVEADVASWRARRP